MLGGAGFRPPTVVRTYLFKYKHLFHVPNGEKVTIFNGFGDYITGVVGGNLKSPKASGGSAKDSISADRRIYWPTYIVLEGSSHLVSS